MGNLHYLNPFAEGVQNPFTDRQEVPRPTTGDAVRMLAKGVGARLRSLASRHAELEATVEELRDANRALRDELSELRNELSGVNERLIATQQDVEGLYPDFIRENQDDE